MKNWIDEFVTLYGSQAQLSADSLKTWKSSELPLLRALGSELIVQRENFLYHLGAEWKRLAIWKLPSSKGKTCFGMFPKEKSNCGHSPSWYLVSLNRFYPGLPQAHPIGC